MVSPPKIESPHGEGLLDPIHFKLFKSIAREGEKTSPSPQELGRGPGVRGGGELSGIEDSKRRLRKKVPLCNEILRSVTSPHLGLSPASEGRGNALWELAIC